MQNCGCHVASWQASSHPIPVLKRLYWLRRWNQTANYDIYRLWQVVGWNTLNLAVIIMHRWLAAAGYIQVATCRCQCPVRPRSYYTVTAPDCTEQHVSTRGAPPFLCKRANQRAAWWCVRIFSANRSAACWEEAAVCHICAGPLLCCQQGGRYGYIVAALTFLKLKFWFGFTQNTEPAAKARFKACLSTLIQYLRL